jgi:hypothetical protein
MADVRQEGTLLFGVQTCISGGTPRGGVARRSAGGFSNISLSLTRWGSPYDRWLEFSKRCSK